MKYAFYYSVIFLLAFSFQITSVEAQKNPPQEKATDTEETLSPAQPPVTATAEEQTEPQAPLPPAGTIINLIGKDNLDAWMTGNDKEITGWEVHDGVLHRAAKGPHLLTKLEFENYILKFQWKVANKVNSGVKYRVRKYQGQTLGCEYQILDDGKAGNRSKHSAAALYALYEPGEEKMLQPVGEFNQAKIVVDGSRLEHWLNGKKVVEATVASDDWMQRVLNSKFSNKEYFGQYPTGRIMIQDHGGEVWFKNMTLEILPPTRQEELLTLRKPFQKKQPEQEPENDPSTEKATEKPQDQLKDKQPAEKQNTEKQQKQTDTPQIRDAKQQEQHQPKGKG